MFVGVGGHLFSSENNTHVESDHAQLSTEHAGRERVKKLYIYIYMIKSIYMISQEGGLGRDS